ncbi:MAG: DUF1549 domain-containing protein [Chthonomonadales bacterium]
MRFALPLALALLALPAFAFAQAKPAAATSNKPILVTALTLTPAEIRLNRARDYCQVVVTGKVGDQTVDLTDRAQFRTASAGVVKIENGRVTPLANGKSSLMVTVAGVQQKANITVTGVGQPDPVSFRYETLPILTKQGCANGSCHGSPHGKGGFSLSLFGYDPDIDRVSLTHDGFNRRVNVMDPAESLLLKKPQLQVPHVGGKRLHKSDFALPILQGWIQEGAKTSVPSNKCTSITIFPDSARVLKSPFLQQQVRVTAHFSDGTERDVTAISTFETSHPNVATVDPNGRVTGKNRGQAGISVRYLHFLESIYFTVIEDVPGFQWRAVAATNFIDQHVNDKLKQLQYLPSGLCSDETFLRRVSLDLTGLLPSSAKVRAFLKDTDKSKRDKLVVELLSTEEYARFWALKKADLMRVSPTHLTNGRAEKFSKWLVDATRSNMPYDQFARTILTAFGDTQQVAPANYFLAIPTSEERTEMTAQVFLGSRLECAKCHNHPFEAWTMKDYYSLSAVFARTQTNKAGLVSLAKTGDVQHPTSHEVLTAWGSTPEQSANPDLDRRAAFAAWLTKPGNPYFARVEVNRIWSELFGRGIVDPVDDFRSSNPPANVPLLDALAKDFEEHGYDRKRTIRMVCASSAYQRTMETNAFNANEDVLFSHAKIRLLTAEQMKDAIGYSTHSMGSTDGLSKLASDLSAKLASRVSEYNKSGGEPGMEKFDPEIKRLTTDLARVENRMDYATQRPYPEKSVFNAAFGQPVRETACTCERRSAPTLMQALELLNGETVHKMALSSADKYAGLTDEQAVEELYLSALSRFPTTREQSTATSYLKKETDRAKALADLVWTLVNTREFLFQH